MPEDEPSTSELVPDGLTVVVRAALLIPMSLATRAFSSLTASAAATRSRPRTAPEAIPVMPTPIKASSSVTAFQRGFR